MEDLWFKHYIENLHRILINLFDDKIKGKLVLDIGSGSGLQTELFCLMGARVIGIDLVPSLVRVANYKIQNQKLDALCQVSDAGYLPFKDENFDIVTCCGSVLNYVPDYRKAIAEISRTLKPDGTLIMSVDSKLTPDYIFHMIHRVILKGPKYLFSNRDCMIDYPHVGFNGETINLPMRFFNYGKLKKALSKEKIKVRYCFGIHSTTGVIPYHIASNPNSAPFIKKFFKRLMRLDRFLIDKHPLTRMSSHFLIIGRKED